MPVPVRPAPTEARDPVDDLADLRRGPVAEGGQVGHHAHVPEHQRDEHVGADGEDVPEQRAAEVRPHPVLVREREDVPDRARRGRRGSRGRVPAQTTAKIVIASAKRLIPVRHFCRKRKRIAEISVPAWPIPTQKTKLMIVERPADRVVHAPDADPAVMNR